MKRHVGLVSIAAVGALAFTDINAAILYDSGLLSFESVGQSMWGTGDAFRKVDSRFLGVEWIDESSSIGVITGSADQVVFPAIGALTVRIFEPTVFVPTPTWTNPLSGYFTGCNCFRDVTVKPATAAVTADTRHGALLDIKSSGKVGLEFGYAIDGGSVDTKAEFRATADVPEFVRPNEYFSLTPANKFDGGTIATQSPKVEAYYSAIMKLTTSIDAEVCALTFGCVKSGPFALPQVDLNQRILSIDPNGLKLLDGAMADDKPFAEVSFLTPKLTLEGGMTVAPPLVGFKLSAPGGIALVSTLPPTPSVTVDLAELSFRVPSIATSGMLSNDGELKSSGRDDVLSLMIDLDGAAVLLGGLPPGGVKGTLIDNGKFKLEVTVDVIDVDAGVVLGVAQAFEFKAELMVDISFDKPVLIAGKDGLRDSWGGKWDELPEFSIDQTTTFTPKFWLSAVLMHDLGLDLGLSGTWELGKLSAVGKVGEWDLLDFSLINQNSRFGFGDTLFETPKLQFSVYDSAFGLQGFKALDGMPFTVVVVPEPATVGLMLAGLLALHLRRRSRSA